MKKPLVTLLLLVNLVKIIAGQGVYSKNLIPEPPNIASLNKFIDIPVSHHTGQAEINIPIFESTVGNELRFNLSLNYHTSGIKVAEIASNVGLGWALNAGGAISRKVNGLPDNNEGGYFRNSYTPEYFETLNDSDLAIFYKEHFVEDQNVDLLPDEYYYNFCGESGRMIISKNLEVQCVPSNNWKIEIMNILDCNNTTQWIITTENGTKFIFGRSMNNARAAIDVIDSWTAGSQGTISSESVWHLLEVILPNSNDFLEVFYEDYQQFYCNPNIDFFTKYDWILLPISVPADQIPYSSWSFNYGRTTIYGKRPSNINSSKFKIYFRHNFARQDILGDFALSAIEIKNVSDEIISKYELNYDHFYYSGALIGSVCGESNQNSRRYRLKLKSINYFSQSNSMLEWYKFEYLTGSQPERLSHAVDYWGYYNGHTENLTYIPTWTFDGITVPAGANRYPNINSNAFALYKIFYPTGGYSMFEYENHDIYDSDFIGENIEGIGPGYTETACVYSGKLIAGIPGFRHEGGNVQVKLYPSNNSCSFDIRCDQGTSGDCGFKIRILDSNHDIVWEAHGSLYENQEKKWSFYLPKSFDGEGYDLELLPCSQTSVIDNVHCCILTDPNVRSNSFYNKTIGGLRIKKIYNYSSSTSLSTIKSFNYQDTLNRSTGVIGVRPQYCYMLPFKYYPSIWYNDGLANAYYFFSNPIVELSNTNGSSVEYKFVTESIAGASGGQNGFISKTFSTHLDSPDYFINEYPFPPKVNYSWRRGLNKEEQIVKNESEASLKRNSKVYKIVDNNSNIWKFFGTILAPVEASNNLSQQKIMIEHYLNFSGYSYLQMDTSMTIFGSDSIKSITRYYYDNPQYQFITKISSIESNGDVIDREYKYPFDFISDPTYAYMVGRNELKTIVMEEIRKNNNIVDGNIFQYRRWGNSVYLKNHLYYDKGHYRTKALFYDYNSKGNCLGFLDRFPTSLNWGYNDNYSINYTVNSSITESASTSFENNESNGWTLYGENTILKAGDEAHTGEYVVKTNSTAGPFKTFVVGQEAEKHPGYTASVWVKGGAGAYLHIEVQDNWETRVEKFNVNDPQHWNLIEVEIPKSKYESLIGPDLEFKVYIAGDANALWDDIRFHPSDASMTTYTYAPLIGMTSQSDANNLPTYHEYDDFGRLKLIRDHKKNILKTFEYNYAH